MKDWRIIANEIDGRSAKQCRERWCNHLDPSIIKGNWTEEEDALILQRQKEMGNKWSKISKMLLGRTENAVKVRWKALDRAAKKAIALAKLGVEAGALDKAAREVIDKAGFGEYFTHRTGHGLGLEIHEEPYIKPNNKFVLEKGMTFTIEPGIYIPNLGGIRIEDDIYLDDEEAISLTYLPRELIFL